MQLGPTSRIPLRRARSLKSLLLGSAARHLAEPGGQDHHVPDALAGALLDHAQHCGRGHGDRGQVDRVGDIADARVGLDAGHLRCARVDRVDGAGEPRGRPEVAQHLVTHGGRVPARADDRHRAGREQPGHRPRLGAVLALFDRGPGGVGRLDRRLDVHNVVFVADALVEAGRPEDLEHLAVAGQRVGHEPADAALAGRRRQVFQ
jgi:hypothetical protein